MPTVPAGVKVPQDHKAKSDTPPSHFSFFDQDGVEWTFEKCTAPALSLGFIRRSRSDEAGMLFSLIEQLAGDDTLAAFDALPMDAGAKVLATLGEHIQAVMGATMGESSASVS